jgi:hypothetical protein
VDHRFDLSAYPVLTDNYAPVEYLTAKVLERAFGATKAIDGDEMLADVVQQQRYGARIPGSVGHEKEKDFLSAEMKLLAQDVEFQTWKQAGAPGQDAQLTNIVAHFFTSAKRRVLFAARYDSHSPSSSGDASGAAILIELARAFGDLNVPPSVGIDMVFLDGGGAPKGSGVIEPSAGATYFAQHLGDLYSDEKPVAAIVLDGLCRSGMRVRKDPASVASAGDQVTAFWNAAQRASREMFADAPGPQLNGDQIPLIEAGISTVFLTDGETPPECSARTLETVGQSLMNYVVP